MWDRQQEEAGGGRGGAQPVRQVTADAHGGLTYPACRRNENEEGAGAGREGARPCQLEHEGDREEEVKKAEEEGVITHGNSDGAEEV